MPQPSQQQGGMLPPSGATVLSSPMGPMIAIDTAPEAFERDGIVSGGRGIRRAPFRAVSLAPMSMPMGQEAAGVPVRVNKME